MSSQDSVPTLVIVGAGFCGAVLATHLLRDGRSPLRILLANRSGPMARGLAYGTRSPLHLLNVPAGRMSAFADREDDFLTFARRHFPGATGGDFLPRSLYGDYLAHRLSEAVAVAQSGITLEQFSGEVSACSVDEAGTTMSLSDGRSVRAERFVLASGNYAPAHPPCATPGFYASSRYVRDPWAPGALGHVDPGRPVLLLGTGLTLYDIALELDRRGQRRGMLALSRRGLLPQPHRALPPPSGDFRPPGLMDRPATVRALLRTVRARIEELAPAGSDWRDVVAALRPVTPALWQRLSLAERRRFLRHLRPWWDTYRHRAAPAIHEAIQGLLADGRLRVEAGRALSYEEGAEGVTVRIQARGSQQLQSITVGAVVNCTGPDGDPATAGDALLDSLLAQGLLRRDPLGLGLEVGADAALLDAAGRPSRFLFLLSPMLKARDWEATAVPELRVHAARLAHHLLASLAPTAASGRR